MVERTRDNLMQIAIKVGHNCGFVVCACSYLETNLEKEMDAKGVHYNRETNISQSVTCRHASHVGIAG